MKSMTTCACLLLIVAFASAQKRPVGYKYEYPIHFRGAPSTYTIDSIKREAVGETARLLFIIDEGADMPYFAHLVLTKTGSDSKLTSNADTDGKIEITIPTGQWQIEISDMERTALQIKYFSPHAGFEYHFAVILGYKTSLLKGMLYSKRELTETEAQKIIDDILDGKENELLTSKVCVTSDMK